MKFVMLIVLAVVVPVAWAGDVYKWVDSEGTVHYGDQPGAKKAKKIELPGLSHYEPPPIKQFEETKPGRPAETLAEDEPETTTRQDAIPDYRELKIISPEQEGTVRSNEGLVDVFLSLAPVLAKDHHIKLKLDGKVMPGKYTSTVIKLAGIDRGEHTLRVAVYDHLGKTRIESESVTFYLQKVSALNRPQPR